MQKNGITKSDAFVMVSQKMDIGASHIQKIYYGVHNKSYTKKRGNPNISNTTLTADEAVSFWRDMTRWGVTISNG